MAIPTIRAVGAVTTQTTSPLAPANPAHATGDLLLCLVGAGNNASSSPSIAAPTGGAWTQVGSGVSVLTGVIRGIIRVFAIRATSGAMANPSMVVAPTGTSSHFAARVISITAGTWKDTGTLTDAWEDITTNSNGAASGDVAVDLSGLVTTGPDRLAIAHLFEADNIPTGLTNNASYTTMGSDSDSSTGSDAYLGSRTLNVPTTGGGGATFTFTAGGGTNSPPALGISFAVKPAAIDLSGSLAAAAATSGNLNTLVILAGTLAAVAALSGIVAKPSAAPTITSLDPSPVTVGTSLTVNLSAGAVTHQLTGTVAAVSSTAGSPAWTARISGTVAAAGWVSGPVSAIVHPTGTVAAVASLSGDPGITGIVDITGTLAATSGTSGAPAVSAPAPTIVSLVPSPVSAGQELTVNLSTGGPLDELSGTLAASSTTAGSPVRTVPFPGAIDGLSGTAGSPVVIRALAGPLAAVASLSGTLTSTGTVELAGTLTATAAPSGQLRFTRVFPGTVAAAATLSGNFDIAGMVSLAGTVTATSALSGEPLALARSPRPTITSLVPNPVTAGQALTVNLAAVAVTHDISGSITAHAATSGPVSRLLLISSSVTAAATLSGEVVRLHAIAGSVAALASPRGQLVTQGVVGMGPDTVAGASAVSGQLAVFRWLPGSLSADSAVGTATKGAGVLTIAPGQYAEWAINDNGGTYQFEVHADSLEGAQLSVLVDSVPLDAWTIYSDEEEGDIMPAHSTTEATFTAVSGAWTQADGAGRTAPASRYKVSITNPSQASGTDARLYVTTTAAGAGAPSADASLTVVEGDYGLWEDFFDANVAVWVRPVGASAITPHIRQYATA